MKGTIVKSICPVCFEEYTVVEIFNFVRCFRCKHEYRLPKLQQDSGDNYSIYFNSFLKSKMEKQKIRRGLL